MDETEIKKIKVLNSFLLKELSGSKVRIKKLEEENQILKVEYEKIKKENENKTFELKDSSDPKNLIIHAPKIGKYKQENEEFYIEVNEDTFDKIQGKSSDWVHELYNPFRIQWTLK